MDNIIIGTYTFGIFKVHTTFAAWKVKRWKNPIFCSKKQATISPCHADPRKVWILTCVNPDQEQFNTSNTDFFTFCSHVLIWSKWVHLSELRSWKTLLTQALLSYYRAVTISTSKFIKSNEAVIRAYIKTGFHQNSLFLTSIEDINRIAILYLKRNSLTFSWPKYFFPILTAIHSSHALLLSSQ